MRLPRGTLVTAFVAVLVVLTGCSKSDPASTVDPSKPYNDADVTFATDMIQHHAQALQMVDLTLSRDLDPQILALADEIRMEQTPEIERMVDLLNSWDKQPIPRTSRDHASADGGDAHMDLSLPGMMSPEDLEGLDAAKGDDFGSKWLALMIEHHRGAIAMASTEIADGEDKRAKALARTIATSQQAQVETLLQLSR